MSLITQDQYDVIMDMFDEGGVLMGKGCRPRSAQQMMVDSICSCLSEEKPLLVEAPTGVGKTYSYLFPITQIIQDSKGKSDSQIRLVVSTATKGLQRQLKGKDFPVLNQVFPNIRIHTWMGASNYLCGARLKKALTKKGVDADVRGEIEALNDIYDALRHLPNGWREELPYAVSDKTWETIQGDSPCCHINPLNPNEEMFCHRRSSAIKARQADILCINHSFLCTIAQYAGVIHPAVETEDSKNEVILVLDEAHDLEDSMRRCLNQDFNFGQLKKHAAKIINISKQSEIQEKLNNIRKILVDNVPEEAIVVRSADAPLAHPLRELCQCMEEIASEIVDQSKRLLDAGTELSEEDKQDMVAIPTALTGNSSLLKSYLNNPTTSAMLEVGKVRYNKTIEPQISFYPFELRDHFQTLWSLTRIPILTSATLFNTTIKDLETNIGLPDALAVTIPAAFDYGKGIKAFCVTQGTRALSTKPAYPQLPSPEIDLIAWLKPAIGLSAGHALVLFTSYMAMNEMAEQLRAWIESQGMRLHVQSRHTDPQEILQKMALEPNTVVFGTNTFWTGVDIKGTNLCNVIITKLPFRMPDNYVKCFGDYLKERQIDAFKSWSIPDMINKTRQGVGRLIRSETDRGLLFMLDPRFVNSGYGRELRHRIYPDSYGRTTLEWTALKVPTDLPNEEETREWLGVTTVGDSGYAGELPLPDGIEPNNEDNIPF